MIWPAQPWIGYSFFTAAGFLFLWGLRVRDQHLWQGWWKQTANAELQGWIPLHEALRYLVYDSRWGAAQPTASSDKSFDAVVSLEFRERLGRGEIAARGKLGLDKSSLQRATEAIPREFWVDAFIQPHGEIVLADDDRCAVSQAGSRHRYRAVLVKRSDAEAAWPRKRDVQLTALAAAVDPLKRKIEAEKNAPLKKTSLGGVR